jgi:hypothetical protein
MQEVSQKVMRQFQAKRIILHTAVFMQLVVPVEEQPNPYPCLNFNTFPCVQICLIKSNIHSTWRSSILLYFKLIRNGWAFLSILASQNFLLVWKWDFCSHVHKTPKCINSNMIAFGRTGYEWKIVDTWNPQFVRGYFIKEKQESDFRLCW